jgi:hypothetical protein
MPTRRDDAPRVHAQYSPHRNQLCHLLATHALGSAAAAGIQLNSYHVTLRSRCKHTTHALQCSTNQLLKHTANSLLRVLHSCCKVTAYFVLSAMHSCCKHTNDALLHIREPAASILHRCCCTLSGSWCKHTAHALLQMLLRKLQAYHPCAAVHCPEAGAGILPVRCCSAPFVWTLPYTLHYI